jgi:phage host-nuclease inhibitor protein Gam
MIKIESREDLEQQMSAALQLLTEIGKEVAKADAQMADKIEAIRETVVEKKTEFDEIDAAIRKFAKKIKNDEEFFGDGRTCETLAGSLSWKMSKPAVECGDGFDEDKFPAIARKLGFEDIIRTPKEELDKTAVIRMYQSGDISDDQLKKLGLKIDQEDGLTIKFKKVDKKKLGVA